MDTVPLFLVWPRPVTGRIMRFDHAGLHNNPVLVRQENWHKAYTFVARTSGVRRFEIPPRGSRCSPAFGLRIKERSPFAHTIVVQLSNDWCGYIPPKRIFDEGHYEAVVAKIQPGEGERLTDEAIELLRELHAEL